MSKRCGSCGSFEIAKAPKFGPFSWKDFQAVFLDKPVEVFQCSKCKEEMGAIGDSKRIDLAIEDVIRRNTNYFIVHIQAREGCKLYELAERVGTTPEYLSSLKSGAKLPSFQVYNFLKTITFDHQAYEIADPKLDIEGLKQASA